MRLLVHLILENILHGKLVFIQLKLEALEIELELDLEHGAIWFYSSIPGVEFVDHVIQKDFCLVNVVPSSVGINNSIVSSSVWLAISVSTFHSSLHMLIEESQNTFELQSILRFEPSRHRQ